MIEMQFILDCVTTVLTAVLCFLMLFHKYEVKQDHLVARIAVIGCIIAVKMGVLLLHMSPLNLLTIWAVCVFVIYTMYQCRLNTALIYSFVFLMIALVADALGVLVVSNFYHNTISETLGATDLVWHHHIWNWILQIFLSRITALIIRKNDNIRVKWHEILFYILLLLFETILFACISSAVQDYMSGQFMILMMSGFMILDIYIMYIFHKISLSRENEQKVRLMQQQEQLQLQMYQELHEKYRTTREIAHDINRHISSLKALIAANPNEQAEHYLSDMTEDTERLRPTIHNQNAMLEIILNTVSDRCEKEHILLEMNVEDFPMQFISDMDMTAIFSNLLDNAIDACLEISKSQRKIYVVLRKQMGLIVLRITNACKETEPREFRFHHSTKAYHSGIGLSNVRKAVEKYNGVFRVHQEKCQFCVSITFNDNT
ncbi:sensor histidine kinase [Ruminococcus sp.]|uniref:sensor histidine kinase n=1 Tax=Ruminococcus sp. TaxID=41978 RepID=UPI0025E2A939|nr:sensor histidine kinase [Ruminococcus sp.]